MKRVLALLTVLTLLAAPVLADELYIRQLPQETYRYNPVLSPESYPEARLTLETALTMFYSGNEPPQLETLCFPLPEGAMVDSFDYHSVSTLDPVRSVQYSYDLRKSMKTDDFLKKAADEKRIVLNESNRAAYVNTAVNQAYALIPTSLGGSTRLFIQISLDTLNDRSDETADGRIQPLSDAILAEIDRVSGRMRVKTYSPYWSDHMYAGIKMIDSYDYDYMLKLRFPTLTLTGPDGSRKAVDLFPCSLSVGDFGGVYHAGGRSYLEVFFGMDTVSLAKNQFEAQEADAQMVMLNDGQAAYVYLSGMTKYGSATSSWISRPLAHYSRKNEQYYFNLKVSGNYTIDSLDAFMAIATPFLDAIEILRASDDPYVPMATVPEETPDEFLPDSEPQQETAEPASESWICTNCGMVNTGNYCAYCGAARPAADTWTCTNCGTANTGKFCTECGTAKPAAGPWTCTNCGTVSEGKFCPECGSPRP